MKYELQEKVVIITGSSRGIGRSTAALCLLRGAYVVINGRNPEKLRQTFDKLHTDHRNRVLAITGDVSSESDMEKLVQKTISTFKRIDVLINNAAISMRGPFQTLTASVAKQVIQINTLGAIIPTIACIPYIQQGGGSIIFLSSISGICGFPGASVYCASKMAMTAIAQSIDAELYDSNTHVGIIYLPYTENDSDKKILTSSGDQKMYQRNYKITQREAAQKIVNLIEKRKKRKILTPIGRFAWVIQGLMPSLADLILRISGGKLHRVVEKNQKKQSSSL